MTTNNFKYTTTTHTQEDISQACEIIAMLQEQVPGMERYSDRWGEETSEGYTYECEGTNQVLDAYLTQETRGWSIVKHSVDGYTLYNILLSEDLATSL